MLSNRPFLLLLVIAGTFVPGLAQASDNAPSSQVSIQALPFSATAITTAGLQPIPYLSTVMMPADIADLQAKLKRQVDKAMTPKSQCFTMRSYKFKGSDSSRDGLRPSGETTCEAASLFSLKDAISAK